MKLIADEAAAHDFFARVSISGDLALVGAAGSAAGGFESGAAYLFRSGSGTWHQEAKLSSTDGADHDAFGSSVSVDGDVLLVGAQLDDDDGDASGSAYVFRRSDGSWVQEAKLTAADAAPGDMFGVSVSIRGDLAVVGAWQDDDGGDGSGSAYVFRNTGGSWEQEAKLLASDAAALNHFGYSVSVSGDVAIVGAVLGSFSHSGAAYVFRYGAGSWQEEARLTASDARSGDSFGQSVSIDGASAIVGAHLVDDAGDGSGAAYAFRYEAGSWVEEAKLMARDAAALDRFGFGVSISGEAAIVGSVRDDDAGEGSGSAYIFQRSGGAWSQVAKLTASDAEPGDQLGQYVAIDGDLAVAGAPFEDDGGTNAGAAYVFDLRSCLASGRAPLEASMARGPCDPGR